MFEIMSNVRLDLFEMAVDAYSRLKRGLPFLYPFEICLVGRYHILCALAQFILCAYAQFYAKAIFVIGWL